MIGFTISCLVQGFAAGVAMACAEDGINRIFNAWDKAEKEKEADARETAARNHRVWARKNTAKYVDSVEYQ